MDPMRQKESNRFSRVFRRAAIRRVGSAIPPLTVNLLESDPGLTDFDELARVCRGTGGRLEVRVCILERRESGRLLTVCLLPVDYACEIDCRGSTSCLAALPTAFLNFEKEAKSLRDMFDGGNRLREERRMRMREMWMKGWQWQGREGKSVGKEQSSPEAARQSPFVVAVGHSGSDAFSQ